MSQLNKGQRFVDPRADRAIRKQGHKLHYIGGTALTDISVMGTEYLVPKTKSMVERDQFCKNLDHALHHQQRSWTFTYAFIHLVDDEIVLRTDYFIADRCTARDVDAAANYILSEEQQKEDVETLLGRVWLATPAKVRNGQEDLLTSLDSWLETCGFYDVEEMQRKHLMAGLEKSILIAQMERKAANA